EYIKASRWRQNSGPATSTAPTTGKNCCCREPEIYEVLEERSVKCAIRIPSNENPGRNIGELLTRAVGRPSHKPVVWYKNFLCQASWKKARRDVARLDFHFG